MDINQILKILTKEFPSNIDQLKFHLYGKEEFRDLCEDFCLCSESIVKLQSESNKSMAMRFEEVREDLRREILMILSNDNGQ
jgi:hypothetical protein